MTTSGSGLPLPWASTTWTSVAPPSNNPPMTALRSSIRYFRPVG
ncbi:MAG: hypothetical protein SFV24_18555 [Gemmatimonadales bacterium]|nr:hypothetical protein [Gemmatimonadales bacterium]